MHKEVTLSETTEGCVPTSVVTARVKPASLGKVEWEVASLNAVLNEVVQMREDLREGMHIIFWCEWLLELASGRAEQVGQCSWDKELCFDKNQWADFGEGVLESYEDGPNKGIDSMEADYPAGKDWWCLQSQKCERHTVAVQHVQHAAHATSTLATQTESMPANHNGPQCCHCGWRGSSHASNCPFK
ncbi:hypothetical protein B0H10DRAFT_1951533 [Mycena sp. CBHHK59/15]|nr:hypothetical protein B0H10DRAFT_1951533 [Mycena sp. CBHHK59/15]